MNEELFTVGGLEQYIPAEHPLRRICEVYNQCLVRMETHWASQASFVRKDGSDSGKGNGSESSKGSNFRSQKRSNDTHASTTDPDAQLFKKSKGAEANLAFVGHALTENPKPP